MNNDRRFNNPAEPFIVSQVMNNKYDFVPSFSVADSTTNYDLKTQQATSFLNVKTAWKVIVWSDQDVSVRFNSTDNPAIPIGAVESPVDFERILEITNIYITNASGSAANIKVMLV